MKEHRVVCDRLRIMDGKKTIHEGVGSTIGSGADRFITNDLEKAKSHLVNRKELVKDYEENRRYYSDDYLEQSNFRIVYREVSEWKEL